MKKRKFKVAIVCTGIPNFFSEGAAKEPLIFAKSLKKEKIEYKIFAIQTDKTITSFVSNSIKKKNLLSKDIEIIRNDPVSKLNKIKNMIFNKSALYFYGSEKSFNELNKKILSYSPNIIIPFFNSAISYTSRISSIPQYLYAGIPPHSIEMVRIKNYFSDFKFFETLKIIKCFIYSFLIKKTYREMFQNKRMIIVSSPDSLLFYKKFSKKSFSFNNFTKNFGVKFVKLSKNNTNFILVGNVQATFTKQGLYHFSNNLINHIKTLRKNFKFNIRIIGHFKPPEKILKKLNFPWVIFTGWIKNISNEYAKALAILVPTTVLCGTRIRIMNAMQAGVPVIAYRNNVKFNKEFKNNKNIFIADNDKEFIKHMKFCLESKNYPFVLKTSLSAKKTVDKHYNPDVICKKIIKKILSDYKKFEYN